MKQGLTLVTISLALALTGCLSTLPDDPEGMQIKMESNESAVESSTISADEEIPAPVAEPQPKVLVNHGRERVDDYYWLREREDPAVIRYLEEENAYTERQLAHVADLRETLFHEIVSRIPQEDESVPVQKDGYWYYTRYEEGKEYPIYARRKGSMEAPEQVMIDVNQLAEGHDYYAVRGTAVSSGNDILAFGADDQGRRFYDIRFRNLDTGEWLPDMIPDTTGNIAWAEDNETIFYTKQDPQTLRWYQIYRHKLGTDPSEDELVYEEKDETFSSWVGKTKSDQYIVIGSFHTIANEYRILPADDPSASPRVFIPRERGHEHSIGHYGDHFYIKTNWNARNFRLMRTPVDATARENWEEVISHRENVLLSTFDLYEDYMVLTERANAGIDIRVIPWQGDWEHYVEFDEEAFDAWVIETPEFGTETFRIGYSSMTTPKTEWEYNARTREREMLKREKVGGGFSADDYVTERIWSDARDGAKIPVTLLYRKGFSRDGSSPLLLYGYGSYGYSIDPSFSSARLSLVDRGFVWAIAHIRGGQEMGREWYDKGKLLDKKNTFTDFIDVAEDLIARGYADRDNVFAYGGSAGGLLTGAVTNMRPDLWKGVVSAVPFVDVVTTMTDPSIPLTTSEYDEWGDPNDPLYFDYILSYSPYDNVRAEPYPAMLVTAGLHDSQVQYWEPAKWVAKLRKVTTGDAPILLHTNMDAGHGGSSGRFRRHEETALVYAFLIDHARR